MIRAWLLWAVLAWARAGGGHSYSGGSRGGGGGFSGGGSGGFSSGGDDGAGLLIWLVVQHPTVGVPVMFAVVAFVVWSKHQQGRDHRVVHRTHHADRPAPGLAAVSTTALRARDPNFSEPLFLDLARLVYTRAQEERGRRNWAALEPFLAPEVVQGLERRGRGVREVREVVIGAARIQGIAIPGDVARVVVLFESNFTEIRDEEGAKPRTYRLLARERWVFARAADTLSPGPDRMRALGCPNCGSPIERLIDGRCASCDAVLDDARLQWRVAQAEVLSAEPLPPIEVTMGAGVEEGTSHPLVQAPDLAAQLRAFRARHPELDWDALQKRIVETFLKIQEAWGEGKWEKARPYETDFLFQQHRYWIERYAREGLRNRLDQVRVTDVALAKVSVDAFYESITVRIFARMRDWTEDKGGRVVGGDPNRDRVFSEYWTFLRSAGKPAQPRDQLDACPSCGAPLDRVAESGVCGYCDAKITGGEFDWTLAAIDQDETYRG